MFGKFVKFAAEMFSECQNVDRVKRPAKNTDVCRGVARGGQGGAFAPPSLYFAPPSKLNS